MLKVVEKQDERAAGEEHLRLDEIAREGARRMLLEALKAEVDDYLERHRSERDEQGHALVVRNGHGQTRKVTLGAGTVELSAPRVDDRRRLSCDDGSDRCGRSQRERMLGKRTDERDEHEDHSRMDKPITSDLTNDISSRAALFDSDTRAAADLRRTWRT